MLNYTHSRCQNQAHKCFTGTNVLQNRANLCVMNGTAAQQTDGSLNLETYRVSKLAGELALVLTQLALLKLICLLNVRHVDSGIQHKGITAQVADLEG